MSDGGDTETLSAMERDAQGHEVFVSLARLNVILHVAGENDLMVEVSNAYLAKAITCVHGSDTKDGDTECDVDEDLSELQTQPESPTLACSVFHNSEHFFGGMY